MTSRDMFEVTEPSEHAALMTSLRFGVLVTHGAEGFGATPMPWVHDADAGVLKGHVSRANPQPGQHGDGDAMALFVGPNAYVTPSLYPSKAIHGKVAPTWNYEVVQVHGSVRWISDRDWILANINALTDRFEATQRKPWKVSDAPDDYVQRLLGMIVGVELTITRIQAVRKLSQNRSDADYAGVLAGLSASDDPQAQAVAALMR